MKRISVLVFLILIFVSASAMANQMEFVGGITYNTFDLTAKVGSASSGSRGLDTDLQSGLGFYGGVRYWYSDTLAFGGGLDSAGSSKGDDSEKLTGPYGEVVMVLNENVKLNVAAVYYSYTGENSGVKAEGNGLGFLIGGDYTYPLKDNVDLLGGVHYRLASIDLDAPANTSYGFNGLRASFGVKIDF